MHKYSILIVLLIGLKVGFSQTNNTAQIDRLVQQVQIMAIENPQEARGILSELNKLSKQINTHESITKSHIASAEFYIASNLWRQANAHIDTALTVAKKDKNIQLQVNLQILYSKLYLKSGNTALSSQVLNEANKLAVKNKNNNLITKVKLAQAENNRLNGNHIEAIKLKKQALNFALKSKNEINEAECFQSIGSSYWQTGHYNEALENYYKSLLIREKISDTLGIIQALKNIGLTYRELGHYEKGLTNLDKGLQLAIQINNLYEKTEILNIIGSLHYRFDRFDEAIKFYNQSLEIRINLKLIKSQIISHENIARALAQKSMYELALDHLSTALSLQEQIVDPIAESSTLTEMGNLNIQKGNIAEALRRYLMALKIRQQFGKDEDIAKSLTNIGLAYRQLGMYKNALKYLEQAHEIISNKGLSGNESSYILQNLGHIYQDQKQYNKSLAIYKEALSLKEKGGDKSGTAKILKNIAQAQLQMRQFNSARSSLSQALKISSRINDAREVADIYNEMGNVERQANNLTEAIKYFRYAAEKYQSLSNFEGKGLCFRKIGEIQVLMKQFNEAEQNINQSIKTGFQTGNAHLLSYGYLAKHDLYKAKGNYKLALDNYIRHIKIKDSLESLKRNEANLEAQIDLELDQKKTEIKVMEAEVEALRQKAELDKTVIEKQRTFRNFLIAIALLLVTIAAATTFNFIQKRRHANALEEKINEIRTINDKLTQSETHLKQTVQTKDKLFSIIAHDLRSPFTALVGLSEVLANNAKNLSTEEICEYSMHINKSATGVLSLTDNLLSWSRSQTGKIKLNPNNYILKELIDNVIGVASIPANEKGIEVIHHVNESINIYADYDTISTAIRNLVNNAIKFTPNGGKIIVSARQLAEYTEITISDTGVGIEPENLSKLFRVDGLTTKGTNQESGTGLGLILCKEFIEKNNGTIKVDSTPGFGTTFTIELKRKQFE